MDVIVRSLETSRKPTLRDASLRLDIGIAVVPFLQVEVQQDGWAHYVSAELLFSISEARYMARKIAVGVSSRARLEKDPGKPGVFVENALQEVNSVLLRQIRVGEIVRLGASGGIFVALDRDEPPASLQDWYGPKGEPLYIDGDIGRHLVQDGPSETTLPLVALTYMIALVSSQPPAKAVERNFGLPPRTAANWIAKAKAAGLIKHPSFEAVR